MNTPAQNTPKPNEAKEEPEVVAKAIRKTKNHILKNTLGLPHPDKTVHFGLDGGKRTPTYMMLKPFSMLQKIF